MHLDARGIPPLEILIRENTRHASVYLAEIGGTEGTGFLTR